MRHRERLVCNFSISRIHSQLRRLTRESNFTPSVLLTAIPFSSSRVFFAFDSDRIEPSTNQPTKQSPTNKVASPRLYSGVHGPHVCDETMVQQPSGHSAGWIMFESGMEELNLLFVQRKGFGDSVEEYKSCKERKSRAKTASSGKPTGHDVLSKLEEGQLSGECRSAGTKEVSSLNYTIKFTSLLHLSAR